MAPPLTHERCRQAVLEVVKAGQAASVTMVIQRQLASSKMNGFGVVQRESRP